ncbi:hypothetical protein O1Q96_26760 [Streptomyces sp. Qhu-G9]|uniref:hypothetical protein n=1 Tax=Streptomyces sp. Qhu-G9 TaxID=3452799 RepID=UPI0022AC0B6E|nr:hypothetical protein [Streptomyces aurantiacus]WAU82968.1 hypothetical protein O1Q96_26760 [Streptomyces aurantiacus]
MTATHVRQADSTKQLRSAGRTRAGARREMTIPPSGGGVGRAGPGDLAPAAAGA